MPYEMHWEKHGLCWKYSGVVTDEELIQSNLEVYDDPRFMDIWYEIADFLAVEGLKILPETMHKVSAMDAEAAKRNPNVCVAVVGTAPLLHGYTRLYELSGAGSLWPVQIFYTEKEARKWIASRDVPE